MCIIHVTLNLCIVPVSCEVNKDVFIWRMQREGVKPDLHTPTLSADSKSLKFPSKTQAKIGPKSVTCSQIFQNRRSHCIEAIFCLRFLRVFQKSADKVGVCKSGFSQTEESNTFLKADLHTPILSANS